MVSVSGETNHLRSESVAQSSDVLGISVSHASMDDIVDLLDRRGGDAKAPPRLIFTANVDHIVNLRTSERFRAAYDKASVITVDGFPVYLYARLRGLRVPARVTGADLVPVLLGRVAPSRHRLFFIASTDETADGIRRRLINRGFAEGSLQIWVPPFGFEQDETYRRRLIEAVHVHRTTLLFLGLGAPKSEIWASENLARIGGCDVLCVGAALDFYAGTRRRAPLLMRRAGLEWFWRFMQEPRRLFGRYFVRSWGFVAAITDDLRGRGR